MRWPRYETDEERAGRATERMRWRYCETGEEQARRDAVIEHMDRFWRDAAGALDELWSMEPHDLNAWMVERLAPISPGLVWELRPVPDDGARGGLVLTAEDRHDLRPIVVDLAARAPEIPGWRVYDERVPVPAADVHPLVEARTELDIAEWRAVPSADDEHVHLTYVSPNPKHENDDDAWQAALCATECLLGERKTAQWIGGIRVVPAMRRPALLMRKAPNPEAEGAVPLAELAGAVDAAIEEIRRALPEQPRWAAQHTEEGVAGHAYNPPPPDDADDYPGVSDIVSGFTTDIRVIEAIRRGPFFSSSHSRCGETFCYAKLERRDPGEPDLDARYALQDAVAEALHGVGAVTGSATGLRYEYLDLALTDLDRSLEIVRDALRAADAPTRSWLLFHDAELANEWLGIHPDTPAPPRAPAEV